MNTSLRRTLLATSVVAIALSAPIVLKEAFLRLTGTVVRQETGIR